MDNVVVNGTNYVMKLCPNDWIIVDTHEIKEPLLTQSIIVSNNKMEQIDLVNRSLNL